MEIPSRHRNAAPGGLPSMPSIFIGVSPPSRPIAFGSTSGNSNRQPGFSLPSPPLSTSNPMVIPNSRGGGAYDDPPPPLPPPRFVPIDGPTGEHPQYLEHRSHHEPAGSAGSGYFGSLNENLKRDARWPSKPDRDEGYGSLSSMASSRSQGSLPTRFGVHHEKYQFRPSVDAYDNALLNKLRSNRTLNNRSPTQSSSLNSPTGDEPMRHPTAPPANDRLHLLKPLSLPTRSKQPLMLESPNRFTDTPIYSAVSPRSNPFPAIQGNKSPNYESGGGSDFERSPIPRPRRTDSCISASDDAGTASTQGSSYEMTVDDVDYAMEDSQHATKKRRASSPPGDEPAYGTGFALHSSNDLLRRREAGASRGSPTPRLSVIPQGSSTSSNGSRSGSFLSLSIGPSGIDRLSPGGISPGGMSPTDPSSCGSPFSIAASPRSSISRSNNGSSSAPQPHHRTLSVENRLSPRGKQLVGEGIMPKAAGGVATKMQGFLMCQCCPKKPKKFDTEKDLRDHEAEKQYTCLYCGNRFKNKNEMERHQNSLHLRKHSWSCSALSGWDRAFHESTASPGQADVCGYCGKEFSRSSADGATEADWEERMKHLTDAHKFRECNSSKKFYRADHFRQHLKHSHSGTSGKWTNMLENACMLDEEPDVPMDRR
ncbi:hypothetical protein MCOR07_003395 [Pyricularia oryzae]|nr:hypothetical protein MCOR30_003848 [Pyricularia oryzae]KAI6624464.1 hypothetical protein MCOR07_003395 [Pyricularia oryzae]KAI6642007.1 hypothetical protein MCOR14_002689 [Pyricularia oryzae]